MFFAAWVTLEDPAGEEHRYRIVGADEFDAAPGYISIDAPLARALIGKSLDTEIQITRPSTQGVGRILEIGATDQVDEYIITAIDYEK